MVLNKAQLQEALRRAAIPFPDTATVIQLRALYDAMQVNPPVSTASTAAAIVNSPAVQNPAEPSTISASAAPAEQGTSELAQLVQELVDNSSENISTVNDSLPSNDENVNSEDEGAVGGYEHRPAPPVDNSSDILARLQREKQILELQKAIRELQGESPAAFTISRPMQRANRIEFKDVEYAVNKFTGDDNYGVKKWLDDFEEVVDLYEVDARFRYMAARRLLEGTAKIFLRNRNLPDYTSLRAALIKRFHRPLSGMEVRDQLSRRTKRADETYQRYVTCMEEIARQGEGVSEEEVVEAIIYGLRDHSGRATLLDTATTVDELVRLLPKYEKRRNTASSSASVAKVGTPSTSMAGRKPSGSKDSAKGPRCFNCSDFGHLSAKCTEPKRPLGGCFNCHSTAHKYSDCPNPKKRSTVGAVTQDEPEQPDQDEDASPSGEVNAFQSVSVAFFP